MVANGNVDAYQVANAFATIFDLDKSKDEKGDINPKDAAIYLSEIKAIYAMIDKMPVEEQQAHNLKMGTLLFADQLVPHIMRDEELMKQQDVKNVVRDWVHHWFDELKQLDDIVTEQMEDDYVGNRY